MHWSGCAARCERQPVAAAVAAQVLRSHAAASRSTDALALESLAYSMLLASDGFRAWRAATPVRDRPDEPMRRASLIEDDGGDASRIRLNRPATRNAFDAGMRDALAEALAFALEHPDAPPVVLSGEGPAFSAGGDLDEFGQRRRRRLGAPDPHAALAGRGSRATLGDRITARLHGACVGAGIEVPAAAARVTARGRARSSACRRCRWA